jgi:hypothetical protein
MKRDTQPDRAIDCIEMKRKIQEAICRQTRGMTPEEELRYFRAQVANGPFANLLRRQRRTRARMATSPRSR